MHQVMVELADKMARRELPEFAEAP